MIKLAMWEQLVTIRDGRAYCPADEKVAQILNYMYDPEIDFETSDVSPSWGMATVAIDRFGARVIDSDEDTSTPEGAEA